MSLQRQVILWIAIYGVMVLGPIALCYVPPLPPARGFWIEFGVALGFVGLAMMGVQFALTARFRWIAREIGLDAMLQFHRQAGLVAFGFVIAHPVVLILASRGYLSFFDPRVNLPRTFALSTAIICLILIVGLTLWRRTLRISYEWWRLTHGLLAALVVLIGLAHTLMVGWYVSILWKQAMWVLLIGGSLGLLAQTRIMKPLLALRRPWRVESVQKELPGLWTITLLPEGHAGLPFRAGQCIWLTIDDRPYALEQHPFTIASSAESPGRLAITIKELGDYTARIGEVTPQARAYVEGPYGAFTLPEDREAPIVMVAGGIGITPFLSMLRTLADRGQRRRMMLIYAGGDLETMPFLAELSEYERTLGLQIVLVPEVPAPDWVGETGLVTPEMLGRLTSDIEGPRTRYFVCGPDPMMDAVEGALLRGGVPLARLTSERFNIA